MDTNRIRQFKTLSETGNMREAASLLGISHAGLSKSVHALEDELGIQLISKDGRGIRITAAGKKLLGRMEECLRAEENLLEGVKSASQKTTLRIGTFEVFSTYLSPNLIRGLQKHTQVIFEEFIPGALEEALVSERVDFGITYRASCTNKGFHSTSCLCD